MFSLCFCVFVFFLFIFLCFLGQGQAFLGSPFTSKKKEAYKEVEEEREMNPTLECPSFLPTSAQRTHLLVPFFLESKSEQKNPDGPEVRKGQMILHNMVDVKKRPRKKCEN